MDNIKCIDQKYSTTRTLITERPQSSKNAEDQFESILFLSDFMHLEQEGGLRSQGYFKKSFEKKPLLSIITVVFNGEEFLEDTILSVLNQTYDNIEYIIIDGGSTDNTLDIIHKYENQVDYWVSGKDKGIYDAMNNGIRSLTGEYVLFLNADDIFFSDDIISKIIPFLKQDYNIFYGKVMMTDDNLVSLGELGDNLLVTKQKLKRYMCVPHQATLYNINFFKKFGLFSLKYKLVSDYEILLRNLDHINFFYLNMTVSKMRNIGASINNQLLSLKEFTTVKINNSDKIKVTNLQIKAYYFYKYLAHKYHELFSV